MGRPEQREVNREGREGTPLLFCGRQKDVTPKHVRVLLPGNCGHVRSHGKRGDCPELSWWKGEAGMSQLERDLKVLRRKTEEGPQAKD